MNLGADEVLSILDDPSTFLDGFGNGEQLRRAVLAGYRRGFRIIFIVGASLAALAFVAAFILMPELGLDREDDQKLKDEAKRRIEEEKASKTKGGDRRLEEKVEAEPNPPGELRQAPRDGLMPAPVPTADLSLSK